MIPEKDLLDIIASQKKIIDSLFNIVVQLQQDNVKLNTAIDVMNTIERR